MRGREPRNPLSETRRNVIRALVGPDDLQVAVTKDQVRSAPDIAFHGEELSRADESTLYHRFEMNHTPPDSESECSEWSRIRRSHFLPKMSGLVSSAYSLRSETNSRTPGNLNRPHGGEDGDLGSATSGSHRQAATGRSALTRDALSICRASFSCENSGIDPMTARCTGPTIPRESARRSFRRGRHESRNARHPSASSCHCKCHL